MSEYNSVAPPQQFNKSQAFAAALQRAKQIAAKINPGASSGSDSGTKRPLDEGSGTEWTEPDAKKVASSPPAVPSRQSNQTMVPGLSGGVFTEDIKVPDKMVGLIIGRGGEQITRLQSESGCKIQMAPDSGGTPDRICTLTGNPQAISRAKELVNAIVHQRYKTEGPGGEGPPRNDMMSGPPQPQTPHNPSFVMVEIMLPGPKVGLVIGKGGETIKQLQDKSRAKMVVIQDGPNQEAEKPLRITGDPQKVEHAKALVYELLAEKENQARGAMNRGGGAGRGGFSSGRGPLGQQRGGEEAQYIVPSNKCGVIIGRGGETIKQINQATGAHCELDRRPNNNPNEKIFLIRGAPEQIEAAKQMIAEKLGQGPPGPGGFQPQQQWGPPQQPYQPPYQQPVDPNFTGGAMPNMAAAPQADYSQQWIEYYRSLGMHTEADAIEQQTKAKQAAQAAAAQQPQPAPQPQQNGASADYSAQWVQYYRSLGKIEQAEAVEQQMKVKQQQSQQSGPAPGAPQPAPQPAAPAQAQTAQFPNYYPGGGFYPGYQYPSGPYPGYNPTPQGPAGPVGEPQAQATVQQ